MPGRWPHAAYTGPMATLATPPQPALAQINRAPVQLWLPSWGLSHCVRAIVTRSTLGVGRHWPPAWHINHFPASPLCSISWFFSGHSDWLGDAGLAPQRLPRVCLSGPFTRPSRTRNSPEGHGMMLMLLPDAMQALTGVEPASLTNRLAPLEDVLDADWQAMAQAVATRAAVSGVGRSLRQAERRIKGWTGLPLRELRGLGRAEQAFFRTLADADGPVRWAEVAADTGYADQSHLCRETRRVTGFPPDELLRRIQGDEGFWIYRVWT